MDFWKQRLGNCRGELHRAIFEGSVDQFRPLEHSHKRTLGVTVRANDSVLDCGCGYGRLLGLMPDHWRGDYLGVDLSPDLIAVAKAMFANREFVVGDLRDLSFLAGRRFDVALVCSVQQMVIRNAGMETWRKMETEIRRVAARVVYLTYGEWD